MSVLEMLDQVNDELIERGESPIVFDHDCREGICGSCSMVINGTPHGPEKASTTCQTFLRSFNDGDELYLEPFRAAAFPVIRDLMVDRSAFDRIIQAGGFVSVEHGRRTGRECPADRSANGRSCDGCGSMYRLRCVRRRLQERLCDAVHRSQSFSSSLVAARQSGTCRASSNA